MQLKENTGGEGSTSLTVEGSGASFSIEFFDAGSWWNVEIVHDRDEISFECADSGPFLESIGIFYFLIKVANDFIDSKSAESLWQIEGMGEMIVPVVKMLNIGIILFCEILGKSSS